MKKKIAALIEKNVADYRQASNSMRELREKVAPETDIYLRLRRQYNMAMDKASGALDVLFDLDPTNPAWKSTRWIE